jgi:nucleoside-diphosphate-sugar epimerase
VGREAAEDMKALVTGGGGFIGGAVCRQLLERGDSVRSYSRGEYPELEQMGIEVVRGDIANAEAVARAAEGCDIVFHAAAKAGVWGSRGDYERINVTGTRCVIDACRARGVTRLVFTSSPSVVFDGGDQNGIDESVPYPRKHLAHYPRTKAAAEAMVLDANGPALATVALRPHLVWGPGDNHLVPRVIARGKKAQLRAVRQPGAPPKLVDSTFIDNAASAHVDAGSKLSPGGPIAGKAYFISNGEPLVLEDLLNRILDAAGLPRIERSIAPRVAYAAGAALELAHAALQWIGIDSEPRLTRFVARQLATAHWFDLSAARRDLGYEPRVSIAEGMEQLAAWLQSNPAILEAMR